MPAKSKAQQRLMQAAEHGATFPKAEQIRQSMSHQQMHDFAVGSEASKPEYVKPKAAAKTVEPPRHRMAGSHDGMFVTEHHRGARKP